MDNNTRILMEKIADDAAQKAVGQTLLSLGINSEDPIEVQRDMAVLHEVRKLHEDKDFQKDLEHIRKWRTTMDAIQSKGVLTIVGILSAGTVAAVWIGFKQFLGK